MNNRQRIIFGLATTLVAATLAVVRTGALSEGPGATWTIDNVMSAMDASTAQDTASADEESAAITDGQSQDTVGAAGYAASVGGTGITLKDEQPAPAAPQEFSMPEDVPYEPEVVLLKVSDDATLEEVNATLAASGAVATSEITAEDLASGLIRVELTEGEDVESAVNALAGSDGIAGAQPNYLYYPMVEGGESDLRALLAESSEAALEPEAPAERVAQEQGEASEDAADATEGVDGEAVEEAGDEGLEATATSDMQAQEGEEALTEVLKESVNDPYAENQWALTSIQVYEAWALAKCEGTVGVAVLDQGPDATHNDLKGNAALVYDATTGGSTYESTVRHGTHVAGIVSADTNNGLGVAGVSYNAATIFVNVFNGGTASTSDVVTAYNYLMEHAEELNIRVANVSFGGAVSKEPDFVDDAMVNAIEQAYADYGIVTVASAGNADNNSAGGVPYYEYPGDYKNIVSVINLEQKSDGSLAKKDTSNYNMPGQTAKNISAPGTSVYSTVLKNGYARSSGTSMAAPQVTGILALEFAANPELTAQEAVSILYSTAVDLGDTGFDEVYGWGAANALAAVQKAKDAAQDDPVDPIVPEPEAPEPSVAGATRIPVGATASYEVADGTLRIAEGDAATLDGTTLTGTSAGTVTIAAVDANGVDRFTFDVGVYDLSGYWSVASALDESYVLDVAWGSLYNCGNIIVFPYHAARNQAWCVESQDDGSVVIRSAMTGKVLDVANASTESMGNILQFVEGDKPWQRWRMTVDQNNYITFLNVNSGLAIDIEGGYVSPGGNVLQFLSHGGLNQKWTLKAVEADVGSIWDGVYEIASSIDRSYVMDVYGASTDLGANVELFVANGGTNQQWVLTHLGGDVYKITSVCSGLSLDIAGGSTDAGTNILQWAYGGSEWQKWWLKPNADGTYSFFRNGTMLVIDACGGVAYAGCNVHQWPAIGSEAQRWYLTQY